MKRLFLITVAALLGLIGSASAQPMSPCPGLKNPASFTSGSTSGLYIGYYSGQIGTKPNSQPNPLTGETGMNMTGSVIPASQLSSQASSGSCQGLESNKRFRIMSSTEGPGTGTQLGKDPNTQYNLPYCPSSYDPTINKSIRLGNCITGAEAEGLYYTMRVSTQNALLFIYYSIVVEAPGHGTAQDPTFVIRVSKKNASNQWVQISDTLCYMVSSYGLVNGQNGWHTYPAGFYRDWNKVAVNLNNYIYEDIRLEIYMGDCSQHGHYGYCYIAGDCQAMSIGASGCPAGFTTVVDTLKAPTGLDNYVWYKSRVDGRYISNLNDVPSEIGFDRLTPLTSTNHIYPCNIEDFRVMDGEGAGTLTNNMVFRCDMTSAMDPAKPFLSKVYVRVINTKPIMGIDTIKSCDGDLTLINKSYVPNNMTGCDTARSRWVIWDRQGSHIYRGGTAHHRFDTVGTYNVSLVSYFRDDTTCYSESTYPIHVLGRPTTRMEVSSNEVCDSEMVVLRDVTQGSVRRDWIIHDSINDTIFGRRTNNDNLELRRIFENYKNPVELRAYNGLFCRDSVNTYDTIWCTASTFDTIEVFQHPELIVTGDTVVCNGQETDITVATETEGCTYKWYLHIDDDNQIANGQTLRVMPYDDTCKYYVKVISSKQCVAWDSVNAYRVNPKLSISRHDMCAGDEVTLTADAAYSYSWSSSPTDSTLLNQLEPDGHGPSILTVKPKETTVYTLVGHGTNDCNANPLTERINVHQIPIATVKYNPAFVDSDNPVVTFTDDSPYSVRRVWYFDEGVGQEITSPCSHNFGEVSSDSVNVTLVAYNDLECSDTLVFRLPVTQFTFYAPNVFNPERPDNNTFSIFTANEQEMFSVFIYDRNGRLVYTSEDLHFKWDGTTADGIKCPQGTYAWVIRYRRPSTEDIVTQKGTVTLLR